MRPCRYSRFRGAGRLRRRLVVGLLLLSQVWTITGIPLPAAARVKDRSRPFPCMDRPCGCMSAEQCWRECCCFTTGEKLAWARANAVEPPPAPAEDPDPPTSEIPTSETDSDNQRECCSSGCCKAKETTTTGDCKHCKKKPSPPSDTNKKPTPGTRWVLGILAQRCQGQDSHQPQSAPPALPPPAWFSLTGQPDLVGVLTAIHLYPESRPQAPDVPPPRLS